MNKRIIVAKYKENNNWYNKYPEAIVYTKEVDLPNRGRESSTYLQHIVNNYDLLDDYTIFCQANPFEHCKNFEKQIEDYKHNYKEYGDKVVSCDENGSPQHTGLKVGVACNKLLGYKLKNYSFVPGAQFVVSKERIKQRSKKFYEKLLVYSLEDGAAPWVLERLWREVFK